MASAPQLPGRPAESSALGAYELVEALGRGGMAETFIGRRRGPGGFDQRVCVKRVLPLFRDDDEFVRLFLEEARLTAGLAHVNIVQVVDFGEASECPYLVLELVRGVDLRRLLRAAAQRGETLTSGVVAYLAHELAAALEHAHGERVVHRDISPSNVLVSIAGEVKLTDFGIAKALAQPKYTQTRVVKGKVPYMAPEYGRQGRFDDRSDLYALGVTLFEAATGQRPYQGVTEIETLDRAQAGDHPPLRALAPDVGPELAALIERLIAPSPEGRHQSAAELIEALEAMPPPPTARRILARSVSVQTAAAGGDSRGGTLRLEGTEHGDLEGIPEPAPADAVTRTRAVQPGTGTGTRPSDTPPPGASAPSQPRSSVAGPGLALALAVLVVGAALLFWLVAS